MPDEGISNFMRIYLLYEPAKDNREKSEFLFDGRIYIDRLSWVGPYLQELGDYKYSWLIENLNRDTSSLIFFLFVAF